MLLKGFRAEELIFGGIAVSAVILETQSIVPALVSCWLLSFYYLIFCWYLFSVPNERKIVRSMLFGVLYSLIWLIIGACAVEMFGEFDWYFFFIEAILLIFISLYLFFSRKNNSDIFTSTNYWRISIIIFINIFILVFK
jgi:hypothetical protein